MLTQSHKEHSNLAQLVQVNGQCRWTKIMHTAHVVCLHSTKERNYQDKLGGQQQ